jgi:opacity protein-like surface antigen
MISRAALLIGCAILVAGTTATQAADLYGNGMKDFSYTTLAAAPSWYARIDGGYAVQDDPDMSEIGTVLDNSSLDDTWTLGGGIGRYFTPSLRGDITYDHRFDADASGTLSAHPAGLDGERTFGIENDVVLFNLYYDFNRSGRFSPYVGAGLGFTFNRTTSGTATSTCNCTGAIEGGEETDFAAALMAGLTMQIGGGQTMVGGSSKDGPMAVDSGRNLYLDLGYRFLYLGDVTTGQIVNSVPVAEVVTVDSITEHEFRVGLRYDFR